MEDLIRRSDAIEAFEDVLDCDFYHVSEETPRERIEAIPSADRPRGKWIDRHGNKVPMTEHSAFCSNCGEWSGYLTNYCGFCGASMKGADDDD